MGGLPFLCNSQASGSIKIGGIATGVFPVMRSFGKPSARAQARPVRIDPLAQLRPAADQRLVRYLHKGMPLSKVAFGGEQRSIGELLDNVLLGSRFSGQGQQLLHRGSALSVFGSFPRLREAQKRAAAEFLVILRKCLQGCISSPLQRALQLSNLLIGSDGQAPSLAFVPKFQ